MLSLLTQGVSTEMGSLGQLQMMPLHSDSPGCHVTYMPHSLSSIATLSW